MRGIRLWAIISATVVVPVAGAQTPIGKSSQALEEPPIAVALPGGTVVGSNSAPTSTGPILTATVDPMPDAKTPAAAAPIADTASPIAGETKKSPPVLPGGTPVSPYLLPGDTCCGPLGGNGPVGQEVYFRAGINSPTGTGTLAHNISEGWAAQIGVRSQFFDPAGDAAWVIDAHVIYARNPGRELDVLTFRTEPVAVHWLNRTGVGLGLGRDWFLSRPGFVLDTWDANFRFGFDAGGRWGAGHVDFSTPFEPGGYRRHYDVFGQAFVGVMASVEIPVGGYQLLFGARCEGARTWSDLIEVDSNFNDVTTTLMFGVRY